MKKFLTFVCALCISGATFAQFSGSGSGTSSDPYLIFNPIQLDQVRNFLGQSGVCFKLMADIDLTEFIADNYPSDGWLPIGNSSAEFQGTFDGNGKTISGLTINRVSTDYVGFFGYISRATIKDLTVVAVSIRGKQYVGGIAGYAYKSNISLCEVEVNLTGTDKLGGVAGYADDSNISFCEVEVNLTGTDYLGGIAGYCESYSSSSTIQNCIATTTIQTAKTTNYCGGIAGYCKKANVYNITISKNHATCAISTKGNYVGGVVGYSNNGYSNNSSSDNRTDITDNYAVGLIQAQQYVGGVVGYTEGYYNNNSGNRSYNYILRNYANAQVIGTTEVGGIVGYSSITNIKSNVALNKVVSGTSKVGRIYGTFRSSYSSSIGTIGTSETNKALTTTQLIVNDVVQSVSDDLQHGQSAGKSVLLYKASYQGIGWDFSSVWDMQETESFPYLAYQTAPPTIDQATAYSGSTTLSGKGTDGATIYISVGGVAYTATCTSNQWQLTVPALVAGSEVRVYAKAADKSRSYATSLTVAYLGSGTQADPYRIYTMEELSNMSGKGYFQLMNDIDLSGCTNWTPIASGSTLSGSFDGQGYTISGLAISSTQSQVGLFAALNEMTIQNLHITLAKSGVSGSDLVGALAAKTIDCTIQNCHVSGTVKGKATTGGLIGEARSTTITDCSMTGTVNGGALIGGIVGNMDYGTISRTFFNGNLVSAIASAKAGGLVGENSATVSECYTSGTVASMSTGAIVGGLIGNNLSNGQITNCYSTATVKANDYAGGLIGYNYAPVTNCYATGNLTSTNHAGGLVGYNDGTLSSVVNCCVMNAKIDVSSSTGTAIRVIGGLKNNAPTPEMNNYALKDMAVSINSIAQKIYDDNLNGAAQTDADLKQEITYLLLGWDMTDVWTIDEGNAYPTLAAFSAGSVEQSLHLSDTQTTYRAGTYPDGLDYTRTIAIGDKYAAFCLPFAVDIEANTTCFAEMYQPLGIALQYQNTQGEEVMKVLFVQTETAAAGAPFVARLQESISTAVVQSDGDSIDAGVIEETVSIYPYEYKADAAGSQAAMPINGTLSFGGALSALNITNAMTLQGTGEFSQATTMDIAPFYTYLSIDSQLLPKCQKVIAFVSSESDTPSSIGALLNDMSDNKVNVYTIDGRCIMQSVSREEALRQLQQGLYLLNKKKVWIP